MDGKTTEEDLVRFLLMVTEGTPITDQVERIAQLAKEASIRTSAINWSGSAETVAHRVVEQIAGDSHAMDYLLTIIKEKDPDAHLINITDYLPYIDEAHFHITNELMVPHSLRRYLLELKGRGYYLGYDFCKSSGLDIRSPSGKNRGNVRVYDNEKWLNELIDLIKHLAQTI